MATREVASRAATRVVVMVAVVAPAEAEAVASRVEVVWEVVTVGAVEAAVWVATRAGPMGARVAREETLRTAPIQLLF